MRRTAVAVLVLLAACSSSGSPKATSSSVPASGSPTSTASSGGPSTTADPSLLSSLDEDGAKAFLILYANQLKQLDDSITQAQVDCVPDAVLDRFTPRELFALVDSGLGALDADDAARIKDALRACSFTEAQIAKAHLT